MNDKVVGMENLPNVFIDKIIMDKKQVAGIDVYDISVRTSMYDNTENPSWKDRNLGIKTKIIFATGNAIYQLNQGTKSAYDYNGFGVFVHSCEDYQEASRLGDYSKYSIVSSITVPKFPNLNVYASCFVDGFEFGNILFDKFYGPLAGERIFFAGEINRQTGYFYDPSTNEEYGGPVHAGQNGFMEGSEHRDESHANLRYVEEENTKITKNWSVFVDQEIELLDPLFAGDTLVSRAPGSYAGLELGPASINPNSPLFAADINGITGAEQQIQNDVNQTTNAYFRTRTFWRNTYFQENNLFTSDNAAANKATEATNLEYANNTYWLGNRAQWVVEWRRELGISTVTSSETPIGG